MKTKKKYSVKVDDKIQNYVKNTKGDKCFTYDEEVKDFVGLIFHCPDCNAEFHLHIAQITLWKKAIDKYTKENKK